MPFIFCSGCQVKSVTAGVRIVVHGEGYAALTVDFAVKTMGFVGREERVKEFIKNEGS